MADRYQLHHGEALAILRDMPSGSVDAVITDPPYSSGGMHIGQKSKTTGAKYSSALVEMAPDFLGDNRDQRSFLSWMNLWLTEAQRIVRPGGVCAMFSDWRQLPTMTDALQIGGWIWRGIVPWAKPWTRPAFKQRAFINSCEYVVWGTNGSATGAETVPLPGFYQAPAPRDREHQTQKPVDVMRSLIRVVPDGGIVLDPFMGSGTTGVAALSEGRKFIGIEMTRHYYDIAQRRIAEVPESLLDLAGADE